MKGIGIQLVDNIDQGNLLDIKINPIRDQGGKIISGLVIGNTLEQNKALILIGSQGDFKYRPDLGVCFEDVLLGADLLEYRHKITEHFAKDGLKITELDLYRTDNIKIIANYES
ncbi:hypothetical protein NJT12_00030 [Flavobacterium sp. AC]|uniref:Uncharacterized protein n=1 Tax=Flavobacterium azizsancarii TaxID=2961580 RepID=A0ABT4W776_9FLAO|nr:hypothetical protein [Flavobacterium azizsancarii]MDA6067989.1 hypothetical protein [Flavobacterium azizsancarii]